MSGILARYLSGVGTDPLTQQGGMEGYLSQYNVNPHWQQYLQNGNPGLLGQNPQYTQGGQNPYTQGENTYQPQTPEAPQQPQQPQYGGLGELTPAMFKSGYLRNDNPMMEKINEHQTFEMNPEFLSFEQRKALEGYNIGQGSANRGGMNTQYAVPKEVYAKAAPKWSGGGAGSVDFLNELVKQLQGA